MFKKLFTEILKNKEDKLIEKVAKEELKENINVIKTLEKYDKGEINISTAEVKAHLSRI